VNVRENYYSVIIIITSLPAVIIPKFSPSENITEDDQSFPSNTAIPVTMSVSASIINNSLCFLGARLKYNEFCKLNFV